MADLLFPGAARAGELFSDGALVAAMVRVETAWSVALVDAGIAPADSVAELASLVSSDDLPRIAHGGEGVGNPVVPLLTLLRERLSPEHPVAARWLHRGLTSQDVLDTALMLCAADAIGRLRIELAQQIAALALLAEQHRGAVMSGRTLTQHAVPVTFGVKAAVWLDGILDAAEVLEAAAALPAQLGGAAGTLAASTTLAALLGLPDPARRAADLATGTALALGLTARRPWHTNRVPVTRFADALVTCCDAWGHLANDVLTLSRPEIAELAEPSVDGRGGSSTMPQKANPVLAVLVRRTALGAPGYGAQLHLAAADARDERPDGAWHLEWSTMQTLVRAALVAASQTSELLAGLQVNVEQMRATAEAARSNLLAERRSLAAADAETDSDGLDQYLGASELIVDDAVARANAWLEAHR